MEDSKPQPQKPPVAAPAAKRAHEEWAAEKKTPVWQALAAKAGSGWHIGSEVTEAEFDQAVDIACNHVSR